MNINEDIRDSEDSNNPLRSSSFQANEIVIEEMVLNHLKNKGSGSLNSLAKDLQKTQSEIFTALKSLLEDGRIKRIRGVTHGINGEWVVVDSQEKGEEASNYSKIGESTENVISDVLSHIHDTINRVRATQVENGNKTDNSASKSEEASKIDNVETEVLNYIKEKGTASLNLLAHDLNKTKSEIFSALSNLLEKRKIKPVKPISHGMNGEWVAVED